MYKKLSLPFLFFSLGMTVHAANFYQVDHGTDQDILEFTVCKKVTNDHVGNNYFVPTKTAGEWSAFYTNPPNGVTIGTCGASANVTNFDDGSMGGWTYEAAAIAQLYSITPAPSGPWLIPSAHSGTNFFLMSHSSEDDGGGGEIVRPAWLTKTTNLVAGGEISVWVNLAQYNPGGVALTVNGVVKANLDTTTVGWVKLSTTDYSAGANTVQIIFNYKDTDYAIGGIDDISLPE